jgi:hypothetical protein
MSFADKCRRYENFAISQAMTQERRRYGFVLERQCSLAKHYASFHEVALAALHPSVDEWREIATTREYLPQSVEDMFASRLRVSNGPPSDSANICLRRKLANV